jgi:hypothetical protein
VLPLAAVVGVVIGAPPLTRTRTATASSTPPRAGPAYGPVVTAFTAGDAGTGPAGTLDIENFPTGDSASDNRTIDVGVDVDTDAGTFNPAEQVRSGNAVIVVHGLDPAILPGATALADNAISDDLPLAATAPPACR